MRPINNKYFGVGGIAVRFHNGTSVVEGHIIKQLGTSKFRVTDGTVTRDVVLMNTLSSLSEITAGFATIEYTQNGVTRYVKTIHSQMLRSTDGQNISWNTNGVINGEFSSSAPVINVPAALGSLAHRYFTVGSGPQSFNIASGFTGTGLTYSITSAPAGAVYTINGSTGAMVVETDDPVNSTADGDAVVRATNSFGYAQQSFPLFVTVAAEFTVLAREANGTVTVESLGSIWAPGITPELDDTFTVSEGA